jgi:hypothetical protein
MTEEPSYMATARSNVKAGHPTSAWVVMRLLWRIDDLERQAELQDQDSD